MERNLKIDISENNAFFLWGARKTGKTSNSDRFFFRLIPTINKKSVKQVLPLPMQGESIKEKIIKIVSVLYKFRCINIC